MIKNISLNIIIPSNFTLVLLCIDSHPISGNCIIIIREKGRTTPLSWPALSVWNVRLCRLYVVNLLVTFWDLMIHPHMGTEKNPIFIWHFLGIKNDTYISHKYSKIIYKSYISTKSKSLKMCAVEHSLHEILHRERGSMIKKNYTCSKLYSPLGNFQC